MPGGLIVIVLLMKSDEYSYFVDLFMMRCAFESYLLWEAGEIWKVIPASELWFHCLVCDCFALKIRNGYGYIGWFIFNAFKFFCRQSTEYTYFTLIWVTSYKIMKRPSTWYDCMRSYDIELFSSCIDVLILSLQRRWVNTYRHISCRKNICMRLKRLLQ